MWDLALGKLTSDEINHLYRIREANYKYWYELYAAIHQGLHADDPICKKFLLIAIERRLMGVKE